MNEIRDICPVSDAEAGAMASSETFADLAEQITAIARTPELVAARMSLTTRFRRRRRGRAGQLASTRKGVGALVASVAILGGGAIALAANGLGSGGQPPGGPGSPAVVRSGVDPSIAAKFGVLSDHGPAATVTIPAAPRVSSSTQSLVQEWGLNVSLARAIHLSDGATAWVAPGDGAICLVLYPQLYHGQVATGICAPYNQAMAGKDLSLLGANPVEAIGMVPDGVHDVTIHEQGGMTASAPVTDNAYDQLVTHPVDGISYTSPIGQVVVSEYSYEATLPGGREGDSRRR